MTTQRMPPRRRRQAPCWPRPRICARRAPKTAQRDWKKQLYRPSPGERPTPRACPLGRQRERPLCATHARPSARSPARGGNLRAGKAIACAARSHRLEPALRRQRSHVTIQADPESRWRAEERRASAAPALIETCLEARSPFSPEERPLGIQQTQQAHTSSLINGSSCLSRRDAGRSLMRRLRVQQVRRSVR
jgi:hypothetical protein